MLKVSRRSLLTGAAAAAALGGPAFAHRLHTALTEVTWNENAQRLEFVHRIHAHDLEAAVARATGRPGAPLSTDEDLARAALYVESRFSAAASEGEALALETVGAEFDADHVFVYQKAEVSVRPQRLGVKNLILMDDFSDQVNFVNVALWDEMRTLLFRGREEMRWASA